MRDLVRVLGVTSSGRRRLPVGGRMACVRHGGDGGRLWTVAIAAAARRAQHGPHRVVGEPERPAARCRPGGSPTAWRRLPEQVGDPGEAGGLVAQDPSQHPGRPLLAGFEDRLSAHDLPPRRRRRHHDLGVEAGERCGHHLARHVTHAGAATCEVGLQLRAGDAVRTGGAAVECERLVGRMGLGREVHAGRHGLDGVAQPARPLSLNSGVTGSRSWAMPATPWPARPRRRATTCRRTAGADCTAGAR